jgi:hypothetical protein
VFIEGLHDSREVQQRSTQSVNFVDDNAVDASGLDILEETVQGGAFQASTRESAIVVAIRQAFPAFVLLASDKRLGRFTLGMQRVEF